MFAEWDGGSSWRHWRCRCGASGTETGCTPSWCLTAQTDLGVNAVQARRGRTLTFFVSNAIIYHVTHRPGSLQIGCRRLPSVSGPLNPPQPEAKTHPPTTATQFSTEERFPVSLKSGCTCRVNVPTHLVSRSLVRLTVLICVSPAGAKQWKFILDLGKRLRKLRLVVQRLLVWLSLPNDATVAGCQSEPLVLMMMPKQIVQIHWMQLHVSIKTLHVYI